MALPNFRIAQMDGGGCPNPRYYTPASGETFAEGQCVRLITDGTIKECVTDDAAALGVALAGATQTDRNGQVPVQEFLNDVVFSGDNSGATFAASHIGSTAALELTSGEHGVNVGTAGNALFQVVDVDDTDTTDTRVLVKVPAAQSQAPGYGTAARDAS